MSGVAGFASPALNAVKISAAAAAAAGHHAMQLIPFLPGNQQQQQHPGVHSAANGSSEQQQQQQQVSDHVVVVCPGFVQLQQPPQGSVIAGSGWQAVGDDLEMDEFGNIYTTGGNPAAAGRQGGSLDSSITGGGGGRGRNGASRGSKATEAQTW
jgi:hypothetical protein